MITTEDKEQERINFTIRFKQALALRNHSEKSLGELKELFDVSRTLIHAWLNADGVASVRTASMLCDILNISFEWLLTGRGYIEGLNMKAADEIALVEQYRNKTSKGQRKIMLYAFTECSDHDLSTATEAQKLKDKQVALKLISKKP